MFATTSNARLSKKLASFLAIGALLTLTGVCSAQNLTGTWIGSDGNTQTNISHSGGTLRTTGWGGPANPDLRGTSYLTGGPKVYTGTWENRKGEWVGRGTTSITVINENTIYSVSQGYVYYRGNKTAWSGAGYSYRKSPVTRSNLGNRWFETEAGWNGVWTRRGHSNVFDAVWTNPSGGRVTAVMTITLSGNQVRIARRNSSDGTAFNYQGMLQSDGRTVRGTYTPANGGTTRTWQATIAN